jgi:flagellar M-ring protein FliF
VTTEDVLGSNTHAGAAATGVIVRERETARDVGPPLGQSDASGRASNSQREVEYQVGRRVEQVATQPGSIRRLHVVAVVRQPLDDKQLEQMRELVTAAVGALPERGDSVVVQSLRAFDAAPTHDAAADLPADRAPVAALPSTPVRAGSSNGYLVGAAALLLGTVLAAAIAWWARRPRAQAMNPQQRQALLEQLDAWMNKPNGGQA